MSSTGCGRGRGYGLDNSPLRKPDSDRSSSASSTPPRLATSDTSLRSSSLNVEANVFIPKKGSSAVPLSLNPGAQEFVPKAKEIVITDTDMLVDFLNQTLRHLHLNPGDFDSNLRFIAGQLGEFLTDEPQMDTACDGIFEWAVTTPNFSYTCARLIEQLIPLVGNNHNGTLLQHMLKRCRTEHTKRDVLVKSSPDRLQSFTVFMAELYTQILVSNNRLSKLRVAISELITTLSDNVEGNESFVKTIIQVLKMSGAYLEDDFIQATGNKRDMDSLLAKLDVMSSK